MNTIFKTTTSPTSGFNFILSDPTPDAYDDIVGDISHPMLGWDYTSVFEKNPIALLGHNSDAPIGVWEDTHVKDGALRARLRLAPRGSTRIADEARALLDAGILRGVSVGFRPTQSAPRSGGVGIHYKRMLLVESSICSIPANPAALLQAQAQATRLGVRDATIQKALVANKNPTLGQKLRTAKQRVEAAKKAYDNSPTSFQRDINFRVLGKLQDDYLELICIARGILSPKARAAKKRAEAEAINRQALSNIGERIAVLWGKIVIARRNQDLALELRWTKEIERLEKSESYIQKLPPPPPKPTKRLTWSASQEQARKVTEAKFGRWDAQAEAALRQAERDAYYEGFASYRDDEFNRKK